ncbi:palmitoyltransferase swf1 [Lambiella insularis]|nr:palmitoyltransferase swf1 [Lambiella insularis]
MGFYQKLILAIASLSFVVFTALFGSLPAFRKTPIGYVNRLIWIKFPSLLLSADRLLSGGRFISLLKRAGHYLMNQNHPLVLIFYLTILTTASLLFLSAAWPRLPAVHRLAALLALALPFYTTYRCVRSSASVITPATLSDHLRHYPYDHVLFSPGAVCRTCRLPKPARSKHCRICNACVAKQDHHCIWVMNCLGRANYVYFVAMLLSLAALLVYGASLCYVLLDATLQETLVRRAKGPAARSHWSVGRSYRQRLDMWAWAFSNDVRIGAVGLLAGMTAPLAGGLFLYHVYLIWAGMTTNESFKWEEWKEDVADGFVYRDTPTEVDAGVGKDAELEPEVNWPVRREQRLVNMVRRQPWRREDDADMQRRGWIRVGSLKEVENIYDLGFWGNSKDVFHTS